MVNEIVEPRFYFSARRVKHIYSVRESPGVDGHFRKYRIQDRPLAERDFRAKLELACVGDHTSQPLQEHEWTHTTCGENLLNSEYSAGPGKALPPSARTLGRVRRQRSRVAELRLEPSVLSLTNQHLCLGRKPERNRSSLQRQSIRRRRWRCPRACSKCSGAPAKSSLRPAPRTSHHVVSSSRAETRNGEFRAREPWPQIGETRQGRIKYHRAASLIEPKFERVHGIA